MTPTTQPAEHTKEQVPATYRLAEAIFAKVAMWQLDKVRCHPTDIYQIITAHEAFTAPESAIEQARLALDKFVRAGRIMTDGPDDSDERWAEKLVVEAWNEARAALSNLTPATDKQG